MSNSTLVYGLCIPSETIKRQFAIYAEKSILVTSLYIKTVTKNGDSVWEFGCSYFSESNEDLLQDINTYKETGSEIMTIVEPLQWNIREDFDRNVRDFIGILGFKSLACSSFGYHNSESSKEHMFIYLKDYVSETENHCIVKWRNDAKFERKKSVLTKFKSIVKIEAQANWFLINSNL